MRIGRHVELRCQKLVTAQEQLRSMVELSMKSEHNLYLACEDFKLFLVLVLPS